MLLFSAAFAEDLQEFAARIRPSVVMLEVVDGAGSYRGNGTGFFVEDGVVATNAHVAVEHPTVAVLADKSRRDVLGILAIDEDKDLALLRVEGSGFPVLPLGDTSKVAVGQDVVVIGSPMGLDQTVSEGVVSALRPDGLPEELGADAVAKAPLVQITAPIAPGSSGSPVLTLDGQVIGVAQSQMTAGNLNFSVAVEALKHLREGSAGEIIEEFSQNKRGRNLLISVAFFGAIAAWLFGPGAWKKVKERRGAAG